MARAIAHRKAYGDSADFFKKQSITWKLALIITGVATAVSVSQIVLFTWYDAKTYLSYKQSRTRMIADVIGANVIPALTFGDRKDATEVLQSLAKAPIIRACYLFDADGGLFAQYIRPAEKMSVPLVSSQTEEEHFEEDAFVVVRPVLASSGVVGRIYLNSDLKDIKKRQHDDLVLGSITGFSFFGLSIVLAFVVQRIFTDPLKELTHTITRISKNKDYSLRADSHWDDEFGVLVEGFNSMVGEIERRDSALAAQNALLERTNKELDQFVYIASHDLKAPLRAVENLSLLIVKECRSLLPPTGIEYLDLLQSRVRRMERLLNDLLEYSRVGRTGGHVESIDVEGLIREVVHLLAPPATFTIVYPKGSPSINTQRTPLEQVLRNLIGNAIKHHHRMDGKIEVGVQVEHGLFEFSVCDNGPGINPRYHEKVFQMFQTLRPRDEVEGSGMGLALVKKIVEDQGGRIWLRSEEEKGSCFYFTWPSQ